MIGARAGTELFAPPFDKPFGARAQFDALGALGACFGRMRRMALGQKLLADLGGDLALERGDDLLFMGVSHARSEEHTSELQSLMRISYAVFCLKKNKHQLKT